MSEFFRRMDAFFREHPYVTFDDFKEFWSEWEDYVKSWYDHSKKWLLFRELILDLCDEYKELYEK